MNKAQNPANRKNKRVIRRRAAWATLAVLFIAWGGPGANAYWQSLSNSNFGAAKADTVPQGSTPAVSLNGTSATVSWAAVATPRGNAVTGYTVARYSSSTGGTKVAAGGGCAGTVTTLRCTEQNVPDGTWYYAVTPVISLWTGTESTRGAGVLVDTTAPTVSVASISPTPNSAGYNNSSPVTVNLSAVDNPGGSGVASIKYALDGGSTVTVNAATAAVSVKGDGTHTLSYFATDVAGNSSSPQIQTIKIDTIAPSTPTVSVPSYVNSTNKANIPVVGTAEAFASVTVTASDAGSAHTSTQTVTASGTGAWNTSGFDLSGLSDGTVTYSVVARDAAGNASPAANATSTKDTVAPTVTSITMANGKSSGVADKGDTLTIVYSTDMAANTLCSSWSNTTASQTATGTVSISANDNILTVTSGSCTAPMIGSVALNGGYNSSASQARTFAATITWTKATGTLVIALGDNGANGTRGSNVSASSPVYSPAAGAADIAGNPLAGTFTAATASGF
ncbi:MULTISPECIES: OmpL47-type beta-barrel domain-containing protein [Arthrobacter]|uniref:Uncharacterized protein n=1 Tax=Arthrobacter terricola TaxID=2547396 RepID=A0A4R5KNA2_9MICC|nr:MULTISPECIES: Ig-like domain-containing protein [Arthrobacter]MBT8161147.1 hypothetical protein [Arthrobacter sp. GN70]TDF96398.1 hypothetical protein E1809_09820 [Arthrobacter terricola]